MTFYQINVSSNILRDSWMDKGNIVIFEIHHINVSSNILRDSWMVKGNVVIFEIYDKIQRQTKYYWILF